MVKTKTTKLVKGSASPKELNMQLQRVQNKAGSLKPAKIRREQSAHWSKKLNEWTSKDMGDAVNMYRNSRAPGYKSKPVSDSVCRSSLD